MRFCGALLSAQFRSLTTRARCRPPPFNRAARCGPSGRPRAQQLSSPALPAQVTSPGATGRSARPTLALALPPLVVVLPLPHSPPPFPTFLPFLELRATARSTSALSSAGRGAAEDGAVSPTAVSRDGDAEAAGQEPTGDTDAG